MSATDKQVLPDLEEMDEEDDDFDPDSVFYLKYIADGEETLEAVAKILRETADMVDGLRKQGWRLVEPVDGGYLHMEKT